MWPVCRSNAAVSPPRWSPTHTALLSGHWPDFASPTPTLPEPTLPYSYGTRTQPPLPLRYPKPASPTPTVPEPSQTVSSPLQLTNSPLPRVVEAHQVERQQPRQFRHVLRERRVRMAAPLARHLVVAQPRVISGHLGSSLVTSGHRWSPLVTSGHLWSPRVISGHLGAISGQSRGNLGAAPPARRAPGAPRAATGARAARGGRRARAPAAGARARRRARTAATRART